MQQFYSLRKIAVMLSATFISYSAISQTPICGPVAQDFNNTGGTTAGFSSWIPPFSSTPGFTYGQTGQNGYLQYCNVPSQGTTIDIMTATYQPAANQIYVGYGFDLGGLAQVSSIRVSVVFMGNNNQPISVPDPTVPSVVYTGSGNNAVASVCDSFLLSQATGFTPGERYAFFIELIAANTSNNNQCITFDNFRTGGTVAAPLPVTFMGFGATQTSKGIELIWNVTAERDVQSYIIERSSTGADFIKLGEVAAKNSSAYSFLDNQPVAGKTFYRIKEVDIDGNSKFSPIVRLNLDKNIALRAYPSPATSEVTIEHSATDKGTLSITTADGRVVKTIEVKPQMTQSFVNTSALKAGLYVVRFVTADGKTQTTKLIKQ